MTRQEQRCSLGAGVIFKAPSFLLGWPSCILLISARFLSSLLPLSHPQTPWFPKRQWKAGLGARYRNRAALVATGSDVTREGGEGWPPVF